MTNPNRHAWICGHCNIGHHDRCKRGWRNAKGVLVCSCIECRDRPPVCLRCGNDNNKEIDQTHWVCADQDACSDTLAVRAENNPIRAQLRLVYSEKLSRQQQELANRIRAEIAKNPDDPNAGYCQCGCGGTTKGGKFQPGHDSKLMSRLRREAKAGSKKALKEIRDRGWEAKI